MSEWTTCPRCELKHRVRPDGACPRCAGGAAAARASQPDFPVAARLAGGVLVFFALVSPGRAAIARLLFDPVGAAVAALALADLVLGAALLLGKPWSVPAARVRALAGLVVGPLLHFALAGALGAGLQLGVAVALLVLLVGTPGTARLATGIAAAGACVMLTSVEYVAAFFRIDPVRLVMARPAAPRDQPGPPVTSVAGREFAYRIATSGGEWREIPRDVHQANRPNADRWLHQPGTNAHVLVSGLRGAQVPTVEASVERALQSLRNTTETYAVAEDRALPNGVRLLRVRFRRNQHDFESYHGFLLCAGDPVQVLAMTRVEHFPANGAQLLAWASSLESTR